MSDPIYISTWMFYYLTLWHHLQTSQQFTFFRLALGGAHGDALAQGQATHVVEGVQGDDLRPANRHMKMLKHWWFETKQLESWNMPFKKEDRSKFIGWFRFALIGGLSG